MLWHTCPKWLWLLSRNVDSNLLKTHPILLIWLPLTTTSSQKLKRSLVVIILPDMKEGNVLFNDAFNTFFLMVIWHWNDDMNAVDHFLMDQNGIFYTEAIHLLHDRWIKYVNIRGQYVENDCIWFSETDLFYLRTHIYQYPSYIVREQRMLLLKRWVLNTDNYQNRCVHFSLF